MRRKKRQLLGDKRRLVKLLKEIESIAEDYADGHITLMRFTTGWKVVLRTPSVNLSDRRLLMDIPFELTLETAMEFAVENKPKF